MTDEEMTGLAINTIRTLSIDAVQQAKPGHPGTPMALAPLIYTMWNRVMRFDPEDPIWPNRDRFVLSNGHASMLLWSALHLTRTKAVNADYERLGHASVSLDDRKKYAAASGVARGAYVLAESPGGFPEVVLIASGNEVILAVEAHEKLIAEGIRSRIVSMPSWDMFEHQTQEYKDSVLPPSLVARVAVEQGSTFGWERYIGKRGRVIGMKTFGASAPLKELQRKFGFIPDSIVTAAKEQVGQGR